MTSSGGVFGALVVFSGSVVYMNILTNVQNRERLLIGTKFPNFEVETDQGKIRFWLREWKKSTRSDSNAKRNVQPLP